MLDDDVGLITASRCLETFGVNPPTGLSVAISRATAPPDLHQAA